MPSLRTLLSDLDPPSTGNPNRVFYVSNTSLSAQNGGQCCLFTAPANTTKVTFEMWGAGGDGQGAKCCESAGTMPTNGSYAIKTVDTAAGCQYTICAAGTGCCFNCGIGSRAFPSYVVDVTAASTIGCAVGGCSGCSEMTRGGFVDGQICCWGLLSGTGLGDVVIDGTGNIGVRSNYCYQHTYMFTPGGWGSDRMTAAVCAVDMTRAGEYIMCSPQSGFGGAGTPGRACGGPSCWGQPGGWGIVKVSYT